MQCRLKRQLRKALSNGVDYAVKHASYAWLSLTLCIMPPNMSIMQAISNSLYNAAKHVSYAWLSLTLYTMLPNMSVMHGYL
jgi:hypothetical protein